jgi:hypothetical protein
VKEHQRRRRVVRPTCRCVDCGGRTTAPSLPAPYARSKVTSDWLAWFIHQKFGLLSPLDRIRRDLAERGVPLAMGTLVSFVERAADLLAPVDGLHWKRLLASSWMATDGTGLEVLLPGLPSAHDGYVELYRNYECAVFQYSPDKSGEGMLAELAREHVAVGSINSPMQCMMKEGCAQCLRRHIDPVTGKPKGIVFTCFNQDQPLDEVDWRT